MQTHMHTHMQVYMLSQRWRDGHISCSSLLHWSLMLVSQSYLDHGPLELIFSIVQVPVPNTQWGQTNQNVGVWSRERFIAVPCKENGWLVPQKDPKLPKQNCRGFLKAMWGRWEWQLSDQLVHTSLIGWWWGWCHRGYHYQSLSSQGPGCSVFIKWSSSIW